MVDSRFHCAHRAHCGHCTYVARILPSTTLSFSDFIQFFPKVVNALSLNTVAEYELKDLQ